MDNSGEGLSLWENFIESIAQVLSRALSTKDTEKVIISFNVLQDRLRQLSVDNLNRLELRSKFPRKCKHSGTCTGNCIKAVFRSFAITYALKYAMGLIPSLLTGKIFKQKDLIYKLGGRDTTSFALFMSMFISTYKGVLCLLRYLRKKNDAFNPFIAGTIAGTSILLDQNRSRRVMIALYLSTRTFHFIFRWLWRHHVYKYFEPFTNPSSIEKPAPKLEKLKTDTSSLLEPQKPRVFDLKSPTINTENAMANRFFSFTRHSRQSSLKSVNSADAININEIERVETVNSGGFSELEDVDDKHHTHHPWRIWMRHTFGTITMMLASSQILNAYACEPQFLNKSYLSFLITHGGVRHLEPKKSRSYLNLIGYVVAASSASGKSKFTGPVSTTIDFASTIPVELPVDKVLEFQDKYKNTPHEFVMCAIQHPYHTFCTIGVFYAFWGEWWRALKLYGPLNLIMTVVFKGKKLLKDPLKSVKQYTKSTLRSVLFLTCYVTAAWCTPCLFRNMRGKDENWMYYVNGLISGAMVLIEQPGRRLELGMYCLPRAIECLWNSLSVKGYVPLIPAGEAIYFSLSTGVLMTLYQNDPGSIHEGYRKFMYRFFGVN
ncbi:hypothetical protein BC833DRAFT_654540 [Globomyces pollinis-pini]|nr:hypothetical protein BC833DRAFT_654540 [Globomyces pollinis-pini]